jgi:hypothetical protein
MPGFRGGEINRLAARVVLLQVAQEACGGIEPASLQDVRDIAASEYYDRMAVFADFPVRLAIQVGSGDQDAELAVP